MLSRACCIAVMVLVALSMPAAAQDMTHLWSDSYGDTAEQIARGLASDSSGNIIITGYMRGSADFGGGPVTSAGSQDMFLAKFAGDGSHLWSDTFGDANDDQWGLTVTTDNLDNVIVAGWFEGTINFGGGYHASLGGRDVFLAKFTAGGLLIWSQTFGSTGRDECWSVTTDTGDNIIMTGLFSGTATFGGPPLPFAGFSDVFLAKYAPDGTGIWSDGFGGIGFDAGQGVATDGEDNIIFCGNFDSTIDFGGDVLTSVDWADAFLVKVKYNGTHLWSQSFGSTNDQILRCVDTDNLGDIAVGGTFEDDIDLGGGSFTSVGGYDICLAKFTRDGAHAWSQTFGSTGAPDVANALAVDDLGNIAVAGVVGGAIDFGGGLLAFGGSIDVFLAWFNTGGDHIDSQIFGDFHSQNGYGVDTGPAGAVALTGYMWSSADFGGGTLTSSGYSDVFLAKFKRMFVGVEDGPVEPAMSVRTHPNPFDESVSIAYSLPVGGRVTMRIYDVAGRLVDTLVDGSKDAGDYEVRWDAGGRHLASAASGIYFIRLECGGVARVEKIVALR